MSEEEKYLIKIGWQYIKGADNWPDIWKDPNSGEHYSLIYALVIQKILERMVKMDFEKELTNLLNKYSLENKSNTPDYILAQYIMKCLNIFNETVNDREKWHKNGILKNQSNKICSDSE